VNLDGDLPGTVSALSPEVQPVIASTDMATWTWRVEPSRAGDFQLVLTVTPLEGDTDSPLVAGIPLRIHLTVTMTAWQRVTSALDAVRGFLLGLGGLLSALGLTFATATLYAWRKLFPKIRPTTADGLVPATDPLAVSDATTGTPEPDQPAPNTDRPPPSTYPS
jgi:hypothetical protein